MSSAVHWFGSVEFWIFFALRLPTKKQRVFDVQNLIRPNWWADEDIRKIMCHFERSFVSKLWITWKKYNLSILLHTKPILCTRWHFSFLSAIQSLKTSWYCEVSNIEETRYLTYVENFCVFSLEFTLFCCLWYMELAKWPNSKRLFLLADVSLMVQGKRKKNCYTPKNFLFFLLFLKFTMFLLSLIHEPNSYLTIMASVLLMF